MRYLKLFEQYNGIEIPDYAWLYMLHILYGGKFSKKSWGEDERMGVKCSESLAKFDCVKYDEESGNYISDGRANSVLNVAFGAKTLLSACERGLKLTKFDIPGHYGYTLSKIPRELFLRKHPKMKESFNQISNLIVSHFNSHTCSNNILKDLSNQDYIKEFNIGRMFEEYKYIPETITLYRGLKSEYVPTDKGYSCWTYSKKQGERFAKYEFSFGYASKPVYSSNPILLETEINVKDISVFIGNNQGESEVILKNPIDNIKIRKFDIEDLKESNMYNLLNINDQNLLIDIKLLIDNYPDLISHSLNNYPTVPVGDDNPYYMCKYCEITSQEITISNHRDNCEWIQATHSLDMYLGQLPEPIRNNWKLYIKELD